MRLYRILLSASLSLSAIACGDDGDGLREGLESLPRETSGAVAVVDTTPAVSDTANQPDTAATDGAELNHPAASPSQSRDWTAGVIERENDVEELARLVEVRSARQDGFDRIVFEFESQIPSYRVEYVDSPVRECGSGRTVELEGDGWLHIGFTPAAAHTEEGESTIEDRRRSPGFPALLQLVRICDFEGHVDWVAAVESPNRFRVLTLPAPARLVVDIRH